MQSFSRAFLAFFTISLVALSINAQQIIDFENLNADFGMVEGDAVFDQYDDGGPCGVRFYIGDPANNTYPTLARVGSPRVAFDGPNTTSPSCSNGTTMDDMPDQSASVGCWFLTDDGIPGATADELRVIYNTPTFQCSGSLIDIDGGEVWTIDAYFQGNLVTTLSFTDTDPGTGDGIATAWQIDLPTNGDPLDELRFTVTKDGNVGIGIAFDNFSACSLQEDECCPGDNLIANGSFENGNTDFISNYQYVNIIGSGTVLQNSYTVTNGIGAPSLSKCWGAVDPKPARKLIPSW